MQKLKLASLSLAAIAGVVAFVAAPVAHAATTSTTVNSTIGSTISLLSSNGTVNVDVIPTASGAQTIASDTVTVSTNNGLGYTLQLADTAGATSLASGGNSIPAIGGTFVAPVALTANTWGYRVDNAGGFGAGPTAATSSTAISAAKFAGVPASTAPQTLKTTATTASNDTTTVWYSVAANTSAAAGAYTNSVTYTAVAN